MIQEFMYPKKLTIVITDRCNSNCFICNRDDYENYIGNKGLFLDIKNLGKLDQAIRHVESIDLTGFGESLLHPQFDIIVEYICSINLKDNLIGIITNGTVLDRKHATILRSRLRCMAISLNAACSEQYSKEMGFSYSKTINNINNFMDELKSEDQRKVELHYVVHKNNYQSMAQFVEIAKTLGITKVCFTPYLVNKEENINYSLLLIPEKYNRAMDDARQLADKLGVRIEGRKFFEEYISESNLEERCQNPYNSIIVNVTGEVLPCCFCGFFRGIPELGNVFETGFESVWFGESYQRLRDKRYLPACQTCNQLLSFDHLYSHFHPVFAKQRNLIEIIKKSGEEWKSAMDRIEIIKQLEVDWNMYQFPQKFVRNQDSDRLLEILKEAIEQNQHGSLKKNEILESLDQHYHDSYLSIQVPPCDDYEINLTDPFFGSGWGYPESNIHGQHWRWLGPRNRSSVYFRLLPGFDYELRAHIHTAPSDILDILQITLNDEPLKDQQIVWDGTNVFHRAVLPKEMIPTENAIKITYFLPSEGGNIDISCRIIAFTRITCKKRIENDEKTH